MHTHEMLSEFLALAPVEWSGAVDRLRKEAGGLQGHEEWARGASVQCAMLSAYLGARGADGLGDSGHDHAAREAMKARRKARKALGYTDPKAGEFSF